MKVTFPTLLVMTLFCSLAQAHDSRGQELLNKGITLRMEGMEVKKVLGRIEKLAEVKFIYSSNTIQANQKVSLQAKDEKLAVVLSMLLNPLGISYEVVGGSRILLRRNAQGSSSLRGGDFHGEALTEPQDRPVSGRVTSSENGEGLPGVSVVVKGTSIGTSTDPAGNFQLSVPDESAVLVFSFIGFLTQEVAVGTRETLNIQLATDAKSLQEVVVVGYGVQQKKDLTGAVATVNARNIETRQSIQLSDALQGTMAGVTVTRSGSSPGAPSSVRVRGVTSLNVNEPLVLIDGVPGLRLEDINPNDVESISVLKDAASQAIYGARAAAGVIVVTTKRGQSGKLQLNYDADIGISAPTTLPEFVNARTFRTLSNEMSRNDGGGVLFDPADNENYEQLHRGDPDQFPDNDWQSMVLSNIPTTRHRHDLSMAIGTDKIKTRGSFGYMTEDGIFANRNFERYTFRINNDVKITNSLDINLDLAYRKSTTILPSFGNAVAFARRYPAWYSGVRTDGEWGEGKDGDNPLAQIVDGGRDTQNESVFNGTIGFTFRPLEGLSIRANISPVYEFYSAENFRTPVQIPRLGGGFYPQGQTNLDLTGRNVTTLTNQLIATYAKSLGNHNFSVLGGYEEVRVDWEQVVSRGRNLAVDLPALTFGDRSLATNDQFASQNNLQSVFSRLTYDYKGRYLLQSNLRLDGSSRFSPDNRWGLFPSVSAGWVVSNERFSLPEFASFLKIRASYGEVGNERVGTVRTGGSEFFNYYPYQGILQPITNILFYENGRTSPALGVRQDFLADRNIRWEKTRTVDLGLDFGFFNDQLLLTVDYYKKMTDDIIDLLDIPNYMGFPQNTRTNVASIEVKGLDLELGYRGRIGDFGYAINGNATFVNSLVTNLGGEFFLTGGGAFINKPGYAYNEWFGFQSNGLFQTQQQANEYRTGAFAGDVWLVDQLTVDSNGDGVFDAPDGIINERDRVPLGPSLPTFTYGGGINLDYKGFDFSLVINGVGRHLRRYEGFQVRPFDEAFGNIPSNIVGNFWSADNTPEQNLNAQYPRLSRRSEVRNYGVSDFWLFNGAYLRIQNVTLGYRLPATMTQKVNLQKLRVYAGLRDYMTLSRNFLRGWDPEAGNTSYPIMKSVLFGLQVQL